MDLRLTRTDRNDTLVLRSPGQIFDLTIEATNLSSISVHKMANGKHQR